MSGSKHKRPTHSPAAANNGAQSNSPRERLQKSTIIKHLAGGARRTTKRTHFSLTHTERHNNITRAAFYVDPLHSGPPSNSHPVHSRERPHLVAAAHLAPRIAAGSRCGLLASSLRRLNCSQLFSLVFLIS